MDGCDCIEPLWQADDLLMKCQSISDFFIVVAYFSIPSELIYFVQKSAFFPYRWALIQFGASIVLCGATHLINMCTFTTHTKTIAVVLTVAKVATAVVSCTTALMLVHVIPDLLSVKSRERFLKAKTEVLDREVRIIRKREETECLLHMLTHEIRSTLDRHTILRTTLVEMGRNLGLAECAVWMPSRSGTTLQLSHALHSNAPLGSVVPINLPIVATIFNSNRAEIIPHTSPLASVKTQKGKYVPPEVVAVRVPLLQLTNLQKNDWPELSAKAFAVMVLMLPPDSARKWQPHELELVEVVADQVAVALSHAAILEESTRARDLLIQKNIALDAARREAELAICARNDFLAVKNHEMRAIISLSSLLLETKLTAEQRVMIETILKSSDLLETPANDVLDISKLGDGSLELEIAPFNLHATFTDGEMSSTVGIIEFPTSSSLGAMGPLLRKLDLLLDSKNQLIRRSAKEAIKLLKEDLEEINADLVELSMVERPNYKSQHWMEEVRELSYHIEDCIDNMVQSRAAAEGKVRFSGRRPQLRVRRRVKIPWLPKTVKPSASIADLRTLLWEARERHERYQLQDCVSSEPRFMFSRNSRAPASSLSLSGAAANNLVGVDGTRGKLTSWLIDEQMEAEQEQLKVLSILGPEGVGKTALAKELYCQLGHQFECRAFVRVSRDPDMRRLLGEILAQVQGRKRDYEYEATSTADNLMDSIRSHLQDKRYFVVIDELWDAAAWDIMNIAFPKGNNCSTIIITAEGKDVASKCYCVNKLEMAPLGNLQDSGKIFFDRVFGSEHKCPDQLMDISCMIIRSCGGFPLAITTIASLLASQIDNTELWDYLQKCFVSRLTGVTLEETCKEVVNICYDALPQDLKTCLLYLAMYPEGSTIRKADLLNQWIAEGFITPKEENQTAAESYFAELINRGMIQPEKIDHNDEVLSCTVHHIVFDLIAQKSREENFITTVDYSQAMPGFSMIARRLSLHFSCAQFASKPEGLKLSQVRSLAFYGLLKCMPSITKFKFLRVLILEFWGDNYHHNTTLDLSKLGILFHLRYLKVSSHIFIVLPSQIRRLKSLETLEIDAQVSAVPTDIFHLPGLLHLSLPNGTELPDGIGRITSLQTLEYFELGSNSEDNAKSLGELMNLQNLHVTCSKALSDHHLKRNLVALSSSIGKLANLKSLRVGPFAVGMTMFIDQDDMPCAPKLLERLELSPSSFIFSRLPTWIGALQKLCVLKIAVRVLLSSDIDTLTGLPVLAVLSLYVQKPNAESVVFNSGSLPTLKYFKYRCAALRLGFQNEALPNLQRLKLCFNVHRAESYTSSLAGIENLLKLKEITAEIGAAAGVHESDRKAAESVLKEATRKHPRFPIHMNVKSVDCIEEESTPVGFMHRIPYILGFLALAVVVVVLIMLFWY